MEKEDNKNKEGKAVVDSKVGNNEEGKEGKGLGRENIKNLGRSISEQESASQKYDEFASGGEENDKKYKKENEKDFEKISVGNKSSIGKIVKIIFGIIFLFLIVFGFYYFILVREGDFSVLAPNNSNGVVVKNAMEKISSVESYSYNGIMKISGDDFYYSLNSDGQVMTDSENSKDFYNAYDFEGDVKKSNDGRDFHINLNTAQKGDDCYFRINDLDFYSSDESDDYSATLLGVFNTWYTISKADYNALFLGNILTNDPIDMWLVSDEYGEMLSFQKDLGLESLDDGRQLHRYEVDVDIESEYKYLFDNIGMISNFVNQGGFVSYLSEKENEEAVKDILKLISNELTFEIWVNEEDGLIYRFVATGDFDRNIINISSDKEESIGMISVNIDYSLYDFNTSQIPDVIGEGNFNEFLSTFLDVFTSSPSTDVSFIDTDGDGLSDDEEAFYGSDIDVVDTDGDGYTDGEEVKYGYDPVVAGSAKLDYNKLAS